MGLYKHYLIPEQIEGWDKGTSIECCTFKCSKGNNLDMDDCQKRPEGINDLP